MTKKRIYLSILTFVVIIGCLVAATFVDISNDEAAAREEQQQAIAQHRAVIEQKHHKLTIVQKLFAKMQVLNPLAITSMRNKHYPGSAVTVEKQLTPGQNYNQYLVSYKSDGLKIYGLLAVPMEIASESAEPAEAFDQESSSATVAAKPKGGWPVIIINHGYVEPKEYSTVDSYKEYVEPFSEHGYVVFKPDFRGNGKSQGEAKQSYISADYVTDDLNAVAAVKGLKTTTGITCIKSTTGVCETLKAQHGTFVNPNKIGVWGHSMGGNITLQDLVITKEVKAAVIWSGVVGSYVDLQHWWEKRVSAGGLSPNDKKTDDLIEKVFSVVGAPDSNPEFWAKVDPTNYITDIAAPVQLQVGLNDTAVPWQFSEKLAQRLRKAGKTVEFYTYPGENHSLTGPEFETAVQRSLEFFDKNLK